MRRGDRQRPIGTGGARPPRTPSCVAAPVVGRMTGSPDRPSERVAICVTGMHRCGTSFLTGALRFLGVSLGDPDRFLRPGFDNPVGYFEIQSIMELNDELLAHLGGAWDQPPVLDPDWELEPSLDGFRDRAVRILDESFGLGKERSDLIGWKDPRISLLLPFWRTVVPIETTIVMVRDPLEVAASLAARRYRVDAPQAAALWLRYMFAATANDPGHLMVRYRDVFNDLGGTLTAVARHLGRQPPDDRAVDEARSGLDLSLRHHDTASMAPRVANPLMEVASRVWNQGTMDVDSVLPEVAAAFARGWLRAPMDAELLARARAEAVTLRETLRQRNRQISALTMSE